MPPFNLRERRSGPAEQRRELTSNLSRPRDSEQGDKSGVRLLHPN